MNAIKLGVITREGRELWMVWKGWEVVTLNGKYWYIMFYCGLSPTGLFGSQEAKTFGTEGSGGKLYCKLKLFFRGVVVEWGGCCKKLNKI
jgi:hypothetical protein